MIRDEIRKIHDAQAEDEGTPFFVSGIEMLLVLFSTPILFCSNMQEPLSLATSIIIGKVCGYTIDIRALLNL